MNGIILAAGRGSRVNQSSKNKPKGMFLYKNKTLIDHILENFKKNMINKTSIVTGYKSKNLKVFSTKKFHNKFWRSTNILYSLYKADNWLKKYTCIVSYSDIFYEKSAISFLKKTKGDIVILYDVNWYKIWKKRFQNPLLDAETFKIKKNNLVQIGDKTKNLKEIQGQYMGVFKITPRGWQIIKKHLKKIKNFETYDITKLLKSLISEKKNLVKVVKYKDKWFEVDTYKDYKIFLKDKNE